MAIVMAIQVKDITHHSFENTPGFRDPFNYDLQTGRLTCPLLLRAGTAPTMAKRALYEQRARLHRLVINCDGPIKKRTVLRREIKKLKHCRADHPLVAHQRLDNICVS